MIESVEKLEDILEPYAGQTVFCKADQKDYRWDPVLGWQHVPIEGTTEVAMSIYDMNCQIIGQLPTLTEEQLGEKTQIITQFIEEMHNRFYMLLCRDINYYTVFMMHSTAEERLEDVVIECAQYVGSIKAIEMADGAIEIWITNDNETHAMYFFPYDGGVEICR